MGGMMREGQGWGECGLMADRRQDQHRSDRGPAPENKKDFDQEQIREGGKGTPKFPMYDTR